MAADRFDHLFIAPGSYDASLRFYRETLGWRVVYEWGGGGEPRGAALSGGEVSLVIAEQHATEDHSWSHGFNGTRPTTHLSVDDLDRRYQQLAVSGVVVVAPEETHWGTRWFVVRDPDGNLIAYEQKLQAQPIRSDGE